MARVAELERAPHEDHVRGGVHEVAEGQEGWRVPLRREAVREDLNALLAELQSTKACFIRCIKPNMELKPKLFSAPMVLDQLRCAGVIEAARDARGIPYPDPV